MVSIKDIAQACGVSTATVSKALNNREDVNPATRDRVRETAKQLGYLPNAMARALKTNRTYNIGVLMVDKADRGLQHYFFASVLDSFKVAMERSGYDLTFISNQIGSQTYSYYEHCMYRNVDGVFAACVDFESADVQTLLASELPVVSVDYVGEGRYAVASDNAKGIAEACGYAIRKGHKQIAFIYGEPSQVTDARKDAFLNTMKAHRLEVPGNLFLEGKYLHPELAYQLTQLLLSDPGCPTCILYPDDICAVAGMTAIRDAGLTPGKEISVIGFDGNPILRMTGPLLTTIRQDTETIGIRAAEIMLRMLQKENIPERERISNVDVQLLEGETVAQL
ncbi:MAG: LacI family transcriptional regulator [Oscillospiraceae bacterium]|nr:LacI family transcriptional regulator [Oscillospiraceae bacterium]